MKKIVAKIKETFGKVTSWFSALFQSILSRIKSKA